MTTLPAEDGWKPGGKRAERWRDVAERALGYAAWEFPPNRHTPLGGAVAEPAAWG
jgi:hypothetical protein